MKSNKKILGHWDTGTLGHWDIYCTIVSQVWDCVGGWYLHIRKLDERVD